jgi:hypothetical protein
MPLMILEFGIADTTADNAAFYASIFCSEREPRTVTEKTVP